TQQDNIGFTTPKCASHGYALLKRDLYVCNGLCHDLCLLQQAVPFGPILEETGMGRALPVCNLEPSLYLDQYRRVLSRCLSEIGGDEHPFWYCILSTLLY